jgi:hypothetical protein
MYGFDNKPEMSAGFVMIGWYLPLQLHRCEHIERLSTDQRMNRYRRRRLLSFELMRGMSPTARPMPNQSQVIEDVCKLSQIR